MLDNRLRKTPLADLSYERDTLLILDRLRTRCIQHGERPEGIDRQLAPFTLMQVFDGSASTIYFPPDNAHLPTPFAEIHRGDKLQAAELLEARPVYLTFRGLDWIASRQAADMFAGRHVRPGLIADRKCLVLGMEPTNIDSPPAATLWVDPARDYVVLRAEQRNAGHLAYRMDISYVEDDSGRFIPHSWQRTHYWPDGTLKMLVESKVADYELGPRLDDDTFTLSFAPGTRVNNLITKDSYVIRADGERVPLLAASTPRASAFPLSIFLLVNGVAIGLVLGSVIAS